MARGWLERAGAGWWRGPGGVRAGWRAGLFVLLNIMFVFAAAYLTPRGLLRALAGGGLLGPGFVTFNEFLLLLPALAATAIMTWLEGRPFVSCGLGGAKPVARLLGGSVAGLVLLGAILLLLAASGHARLAWGGLGFGAVCGFALAWAGASLLTGLAEEIALRGYLLQILTRGFGFWPALVLTSLLFGVLHTGNSGEGFLGIVNVTLCGALLALGVRGTGSLWWSIGLHGAWDYAENFLAGTPDSGQICAGALLRTTPHGAAWLSGGATGPEGSLLTLAVLVPALVLAWRGFAPRRV